jgi:hypothetical protein
MHPVHNIPPYFPKIYSDILFPSTPRSSEFSSFQVFQPKFLGTIVTGNLTRGKGLVVDLPAFKISTLLLGLQLQFCSRGPFEKFVDTRYYSKSEVCGDAVTLFFMVPPLSSDALLTTLHPLLENVLLTVCRKLQEEWNQTILTS